MTTLAAYQGDGWSVVGADSRATEEGGSVLLLANPKISTVGQYIFAVTGASRGGNLVQQGWTPPKAPATTDIHKLDVFITKKFIPSMRKLFIDAGYDAKDDGDQAFHDGGFLVSVNGIIYPIFSDYSWDRDVRRIYASGSGGEVALGAMVALGIEKTRTPEQAEKIIRRAIEISCDWNAYCTPPIITMIQDA
jgi:hypothetical protein